MSSLIQSVRILGPSSTPDKTYTEILDGSTITDNSPELSLANGLNRRRGVAKRFVIRIGEPSAYADLKQGMFDRKLVSIAVQMPAGLDTWAKCRYVVRPLMSEIPDVSEVFFALNTVNHTTTPPSEGAAGWTNLGPTIGNTQPEPEVVTVDDGLGRPMFNFSRLVQVFEVAGLEAYAALSVLEQARTLVKIGMVHPDGAVRIYQNVQVEVRTIPNYGGSGLYSTQVRLIAAGKDFADYIVPPVTARHDFYGAVLEAATWGYREADILTTTVGTIG